MGAEADTVASILAGSSENIRSAVAPTVRRAITKSAIFVFLGVVGARLSFFFAIHNIVYIAE